MEVNSKPHVSTAFTSAEKAVGTRQIGDCMGPTGGLNKRKSLTTTKNRKVFLSLPTRIKPLKTKRRLIYIKVQSVPRCKHFSSRL